MLLPSYWRALGEYHKGRMVRLNLSQVKNYSLFPGQVCVLYMHIYIIYAYITCVCDCKSTCVCVCVCVGGCMYHMRGTLEKEDTGILMPYMTILPLRN